MARHAWWTRRAVRRMAVSVNLLLLLSALLSALTGGASAMRAPTAAHAVASAAATVQAEVRSARIASRPQQGLPTLALISTLPVPDAPATVAAFEPLYASRRRE